MQEIIVKGKKIILTDHALKRMSGRRISEKELTSVFTYGRHFYAKGAKVYFVGKKEVKKAKINGLNLSELEGINVIVQKTLDGEIVVTTFKNNTLKHYKC